MWLNVLSLIFLFTSILNSVVFCLGDIGANERLLRYARCLLRRKGKVYLVGFDGFEIPEELCEHENLSVTFVFAFWDYPKILAPLLWPLEFLFLMIQMIGVALNISQAIDYVICQDKRFVMEPVIGKLVARVTGARLICDVVSCAWFASEITKFIGKRSLSLANVLVTSTCAMQRVFKIGGLSSHCLENIPDGVFSTDKDTRRVVHRLYELAENCICVAVTCVESAAYFDVLRDIGKELKEGKVNVCFFVCGHSKLCSEFNRQGPLCSKIGNEFAKFVYVPYQYDIYPTVISACDFAMCEHASPNVLDISMPILEMQACGLPVIAQRYGCVTERVKDGVNGMLFDDPEGLRTILRSILITRTVNIATMRTTVHTTPDWDEVLSHVLS